MVYRNRMNNLFTITSNFLIFGLLLSNVSCTKTKWNYERGGNDWQESCLTSDQGPIDIVQPFEYKGFNISFSYSNMMTEYSFMNDGNNLILEGDFGYIVYENRTYFSSQILFYNPSLHTFSNNRMPLELQVLHKDDKGNQISISILFKYSPSDYSLLLAKLGFDEESLKYLTPLQPKILKEEIDLSKYISSNKDFFVYNSKLFSPPCDKSSLNFIITDVMKISSKQINNFPLMVLNKHRDTQKKNNRTIFTTFKMEDVEKKVDDQNKGLESIKKQKLENDALNNMTENKQVKKDTSTVEKPAQTKDKSNKKDNQIIENNNKQNNKTNADCKKNDNIPINDVEERVKAYQKQIKANDIKYIESGKGEGSVHIDKDIPDSLNSRTRKDLEEKFQQWLQLLKETKNQANAKNTNAFIQMKALEKELIKYDYEPFLEFVKTHKLHILNDNIGENNFLQTSSNKISLSKIKNSVPKRAKKDNISEQNKTVSKSQNPNTVAKTNDKMFLGLNENYNMENHNKNFFE